MPRPHPSSGGAPDSTVAWDGGGLFDEEMDVQGANPDTPDLDGTEARGSEEVSSAQSCSTNGLNATSAIWITLARSYSSTDSRHSALQIEHERHGITCINHPETPYSYGCPGRCQPSCCGRTWYRCRATFPNRDEEGSHGRITLHALYPVHDQLALSRQVELEA